MTNNISTLLTKNQQHTNLNTVKDVDDIANGTIVPIDIEPLSGVRESLEELIKSSIKGIVGYYDTGLALIEIRNSKLYKPEYSNFYTYCRDKFELSESRIKQLIRAVTITDSVKIVVNENQINLSESFCRELYKIKDVQVRSQCLKAAAQKGKLTAKALHQEYREMTLEESAKRQLPELPEVGAIVRLSTRKNPVLNYLNQFWGIVRQKHTYTVSVEVLGNLVESVNPYELVTFDDQDLDKDLANTLLDRLNAINNHPATTILVKEICNFIATQPYPSLDRVDNLILQTIERDLDLI